MTHEQEHSPKDELGAWLHDLRESDEAMRKAAARLLQALAQDNEAAKALAASLENIGQVSHAFSPFECATASALSALTKSLQKLDKSPFVNALEELGPYGDTHLTESLEKALLEADNRFQTNAIRTLGIIAGKQGAVLDDLIIALDHPDDTQRESAVLLLGTMASKAKHALPRLRTALQDPVWSVRWAAVWAIWKIDSSFSHSLEAECQPLKEVRKDIRRAATRAFRRIGSEAGQALQEYLQEDGELDPELAEAAKRALSKLTGEEQLD